MAAIFADDIFIYILQENFCSLIQISLKFVQVNNKSQSHQAIIWTSDNM